MPILQTEVHGADCPARTYALTLTILASLVLPLHAQVVTVTIQGRDL